MIENNKNSKYYKTISEVAKELDLVDKKTGKLQTHTLRYWETQFKQIKPYIGPGRRRYYSKKIFEIIKSIKNLLKQKGMTVKGVKKILNTSIVDSLDPTTDISVYKSHFNEAKDIKKRLKNISKIISELKKLK
jgi:DNA-binding transcriptional MerR regulator